MAKSAVKKSQIVIDGAKKKTNPTETPVVSRTEEMENNSVVSTEILTGETTVSFKVDPGDKDLKEKDNNLLKTTMRAVEELRVQMRLVFSRNGSINVLLTGNKDKVIEATKIVQQKLEPKKKLAFTIEKKFLPQLVGKEGKHIIEMMNRTNTKIRVDFDTKSVSIVGSKECVADAQNEINTFLSSLLKSERTTVLVPQKLHIFFRLALNEEIIRMFSEEDSPLRIHIPPSNKSSNEIALVGKAISLEKAKKYILSKIEEIQDTYVETEISVPKYTHRFLLHDHTIEKVLKASGVLVTIPAANSTKTDLIFYGEPNKIREAVMMTLSRCEGIVQKRLDVPKWLQKLLKGAQNDQFKEIRTVNTSVTIKFENKTEYLIVEGESAPAEIVYAKLAALVADLLEKYVKISIEVDGKYISSIIGRQGNNINSIKDKTNTYIYIESDEQQQKENASHVINIIGPKENVDSAKKDIMEKVLYLSALSTVSIPLSSCYHRFIIGPKGEAVKGLREQLNNEVNFTFDQDKETVTLTGPCHLVRKATEIISELVEDLSKDRFKQDISIPYASQQLLFGPKRQLLKEVKEATGVASIFLPRQSEPSDKIGVVGSESAVCEAVKMIKAKYATLLKSKKITLSVPKQYHDYFLSSDCEKLQALLKSLKIRESEVFIEFSDSEPSGEVSGQIVIAGITSHINKLKKQFLKSVEEVKENFYTENIKIKHEFHGWIIGKKGSKISQISAKHDTKIVFPNQDSSLPDIIKLVGKKENVIAVKRILSDISSKIENSASVSLEITPTQYYWFTNANNDDHISLMTEFAEKHNLIINCYPVSKNKPVKAYKLIASGNKDGMKKCEKDLHKMLDPILNYVSAEVIISSGQYKVLAADRNKLLYKLSTQYSVIINKLPSSAGQTGSPPSGSGECPTSPTDMNHESSPTCSPDSLESAEIIPSKTPRSSNSSIVTVKITGFAENVEKVKTDIVRIVPKSTKLTLPMSMHGSLIGQKGCNIKAILDGLCVKVMFPTIDTPCEEIEFFGDKEEVDLAFQRAQAYLEDIKLKSFSLDTKFDKKWLPRIIGRGGANIDELKTTYNVTISIKDKESSNTIEEIHVNSLHETPKDSLKQAVAAAAAAAVSHNEPSAVSKTILSISGYKQNCEAAKAAIEKMIEEWESFITKRLIIPSQFKGKVIGVRWKNINSLSKQYNVSISLAEEDDRESSPLEITGLERDVTACIDRLESIICDIKEEFEEDEGFIAKKKDLKPIENDELAKLLSPMMTSNSQKKEKMPENVNSKKPKKAQGVVTLPSTDTMESLNETFPALNKMSLSNNDGRQRKATNKTQSDAPIKKKTPTKGTS